jgi:hypothetical protein
MAMILQNTYWFDIIHRSSASPPSIDGKWLYWGRTEELHSWLERLNDLVESGKIAAAKVARKLPGLDPFPNKPCVLCVFTSGDENTKETVRALLKDNFNIDVTVWKSEEQTIQDWQPGGWLAVEAEINRLRQRLKDRGLGEREKERLQDLAALLRKRAKEITEPDRIAELHLGQTADLAYQLDADLRSDQTSATSILARLDEISAQITMISSRVEQMPPQAASNLVTESPNYLFVIMPFAEGHVDTYDAIGRAVRKTNEHLVVDRVDERPGAVQITDEIRKSIRKTRLVICDLTEERPNVYYELGFAHGLGKNVICLARKGTKIHFDVYGLKILFFDTYRSLEEQLQKELRALLKP